MEIEGKKIMEKISFLIALSRLIFMFIFVIFFIIIPGDIF